MESRTMDVTTYNHFMKLTPKQKKDCLLVNEVKRYKFLYDKNEMYHKRPRHRKIAWDEIGSVLGMDGIDCMNRWKILRDRYRKQKRMSLQPPTPRIASNRNNKWRYYEMFSFLDPFLDDIKPIGSKGEDSMEFQSSADESSHLGFPTSTDQTNPTSSSTEPVPLQFIRVIVPMTELPQTSTSASNKSPKKFVKILPKTESCENSTGNRLSKQQHSIAQEQATAIELGEHSSNDSLGFSSQEKLDTVDHLMAFMGSTIKQLSLKSQIKICQELTSAFFNIISNEEEEEDS